MMLASVTLNTLPSADAAFAGNGLTRLNVLQGVRSPLWPICFPVYASSHCYQLQRNTRYERLAKPYSAGTFTQQEAPSFAWRTNVSVAPEVCRLICPKNGTHHKVQIFCSKLFSFQAANLGEAAAFRRRTRCNVLGDVFCKLVIQFFYF